MNKKTVKILIIIGWLGLIGIGILILVLTRSKVLKDTLVDGNPYLNNKEEYHLSLNNVALETENSPLFLCDANSIPEYLDSFASEIDDDLQKVSDENLVRWRKDDMDVLVYDIDTTVLTINLSCCPESIGFTSIDRFISSYLNPSIKYTEPVIDDGEEIDMYRVNRLMDEKELKTGYGYSDYFLVKNGYLSTARVLLAQIEKSEYVVPMINDTDLLDSYLSNSEYPKNMVLDTSLIIVTDEFSYEIVESEFRYESCSINEIKPTLYFANCIQNYIYYSYEISGVCDVEYEEQLYTLPFLGFINAVDPEYVKSIE